MSGATMDLRSGWDLLLAEHDKICPRTHPVKIEHKECLEHFRQLVTKIVYRDWAVHVHDQNSVACMQICTVMPDTETGELIENNSRLLPLCQGMSDGFVVDLAFELIKEFELHEAAERFRINGVRPYYPHDHSGQPVREVRPVRVMPPLLTSSRG